MRKGGTKKEKIPHHERKSFAHGILFLMRLVVSGGMAEFWLRDLTLQSKIKREGWDSGMYNHYALG